MYHIWVSRPRIWNYIYCFWKEEFGRKCILEHRSVLAITRKRFSETTVYQLNMPQSKKIYRDSSSRGTSSSPDQGFFEPILDNPKELLRRTGIQVYADDGEHTSEDAARLVASVIDSASTVGPRTSNTFHQIIKIRDKDKPKVVLPKLHLRSINKIIFNGASHELFDQVTALAFTPQF